MNSIEKVKKVFVLASIDSGGKTVYLRSLHGVRGWEIVTDIEIATKCWNKEVAEILLDAYEYETQSLKAFVIIPLEITYTLIDYNN